MSKFADTCLKVIDSGRCIGDCCGPIPIDRAVVEANKHLVNVKYIEMIPERELSYPLCKDVMCVFLDRVKIRCLIYDQRPDVCRKFGDESHKALWCPYIDKDGEVRTRAERREVKRKHNMNWQEVLARAKEE